MTTVKLSALQIELARFYSLPKKHQILALPLMTKPARDAVTEKARTSFTAGAKLGADFVTHSTAEILLYLEALNFNVEKKAKFKEVFVRLKVQNLPNSLDSLETIEAALLGEIMAARNKKETFTAEIRAKAALLTVTGDGVARAATLNDFTHFEVDTAPAKADKYFYNAAYNEHHAISQFLPILEAYRMAKAYRGNVLALIEGRKAQKLLDAEYGVTA
jgi:hypothetical protein